MRLGGPIFQTVDSPEQWALAHKALGYSAAWLPLDNPDDPKLDGFVAAARNADLVLAEVGAWSNTISSDESERRKAIANCQRKLLLAEKAGARCCVNIAGSRGARWDGPHPDNLSDATFDLLVQTVREIIDAVKPTRTCYSLETMPWVFPDSPDTYLALIKAIDRKAFGVHLDPVNMINCPIRAYRSGDFLRECFDKLGPFIKCCHVKDIRFTQHLTLHLDECRPGTGCLDYKTYLTEVAKLDADVPLMLEHLSTAEEYKLAADHIRNVAKDIKVKL